MSSVFLMLVSEAVFYILVIVVVVRVVKALKKARQAVAEQVKQNRKMGRIHSQSQTSQQAANTKTSASARTVIPARQTAPITRNTAPSENGQGEGVQMNTLDYLRNKADQDAMDHARDERMVQQEILRETGGAGIGERLLEGEGVPDNKMMIKCSYCGAENLLPLGVRGKYTCYFCREFLT